jgi:glycosyltransferase involved in cell wall biosynthesis
MRLIGRLVQGYAALRLRRSWRSARPQTRQLLAFLPRRNQGWILHCLCKDLFAQLSLSTQVDVGIVGSVAQLHTRSRRVDVYVLLLDLKHLAVVLQSGFPPERIIFYHTHVRLGVEALGLDRVHAVLALNRFEQNLLHMRKVEARRIHCFPAGFDPNVFFVSSTPGGDTSDVQGLNACRHDVLFVGRYRSGRDGYYHKRKRYGFQVALAHRLVELGWRLAFLGPGWEACEYGLDERVECLQVDHADYGSVYRSARLVCCVSAQEGGPVSYLEGMACGCLMVSTPTGFAADLESGSMGSWLLPLSASVEEWAQKIASLLQSDVPSRVDLARDRAELLVAAQFPVLARQLVNLCWPEMEIPC